MADYTFGNAGSVANTSNPTLTTLSPTIPRGTTSGDVLFLWATGASGNDPVWSVPAGWTELGEHLNASTGIGGAERNGMQLWYKVAGSSESSPTVTRSYASTIGRWQSAIYRYVPSSPSFEFDLVADCEDYATAQFSGNTIDVGRTSTVVAFVASIGVSTTLAASNAQGFVRQATQSSTPAHAWYDKATTAGTVSLPDFATPTYSHLAKVFAFDRTVVTNEWGVDQVRW